ncbi:MAG: hypothetical protein AAGA22_04730 [Pseudomonadota bacterium]
MSVSVQPSLLAGAESILSSDEMYRLGLEASIGVGNDDLVTAHKWFNLAAMQGHVEARTYRKELSMEMTQDQVAEAQRMAREYLSRISPPAPKAAVEAASTAPLLRVVETAGA